MKHTLDFMQKNKLKVGTFTYFRHCKNSVSYNTNLFKKSESVFDISKSR